MRKHRHPEQFERIIEHIREDIGEHRDGEEITLHEYIERTGHLSSAEYIIQDKPQEFAMLTLYMALANKLLGREYGKTMEKAMGLLEAYKKLCEKEQGENKRLLSVILGMCLGLFWFMVGSPSIPFLSALFTRAAILGLYELWKYLRGIYKKKKEWK